MVGEQRGGSGLRGGGGGQKALLEAVFFLGVVFLWVVVWEERVGRPSMVMMMMAIIFLKYIFIYIHLHRHIRTHAPTFQPRHDLVALALDLLEGRVRPRVPLQDGGRLF